MALCFYLQFKISAVEKMKAKVVALLANNDSILRGNRKIEEPSPNIETKIAINDGLEKILRLP